MELINWFLRLKTSNLNSAQITKEDIQNSKKILFALFTRYGDTIIDLVVIEEFINNYKNKDYLIICPKQMKPYVSEFLPEVQCIDINKRNWFELFKVNLVLKRFNPDLGFNPWSTGLDSSYFLSYCKKYFLYKYFKKPKIVNHYQIIRRYLNLKENDWKIKEFNINLNYKRILICPQSTSTERSISQNQLDEIIKKVKIVFNNPEITIASMSSRFFRDDFQNFKFKKNAISSSNFIKLCKGCDLIVCADSAPLHIANKLNKNVVAVFNETSPDLVINSGSKVKLFSDFSKSL